MSEEVGIYGGRQSGHTFASSTGSGNPAAAARHDGETLSRDADISPLTPYYQDALCTIYHGDCRVIMPHLKGCDLLLTDPPYGISLNTDGRRFSGGTAGHVGKHGNGIGSANGKKIANDEKPFDPSFLLAAAPHKIIWGWNHFPDKLPRGSCLVWLKRNDEAFGSFLSDAELAWMSKGHGVYCRRDLTNNAIANARVHPTQKPTNLMLWCLSFFPGAATVLDPFMGSGTTLRACKDMGKRCVGIEIEESHCETAAKRLAQESFNFAGGDADFGVTDSNISSQAELLDSPNGGSELRPPAEKA